MNNRHKFKAYSHHSNSIEFWDEEDYGLLFSGADGMEEPMQSTGSVDKLGTPIFEGDVVLWFGEDPFDATPHSRKMIVGWNQRVMSYRLYEWANQGGGEHFFAEDCQVIGNVFDWQNPECLYQLDKSVKHLGKERLANSLIEQ